MPDNPASIEQTVIGFDFGLKKIGVALGNTITRQARPLCILKTITREQRFTQIAELLAKWEPGLIIVGLPLTLDDQEQQASTASRRFSRQLEGRFGIKAVLVDERGSSLEAQHILGTNADDDAVAAAVILQRYLDTLPG